jgi:hypothetical protein
VLAEIRRFIVHIKAIEKHDLLLEPREWHSFRRKSPARLPSETDQIACFSPLIFTGARRNPAIYGTNQGN